VNEVTASGRREKENRKALVLGGGGILGAAYELGALAAVEDRFGPGSLFREFDIFLGTSAGSIVAALLAQGIPPHEICEGIRLGLPTYRLEQKSIYRLDLNRLRRALYGLTAGLFREAAVGVKRGRLPTFLGLSFAVQESLPAGFFRLDPLDHYLCNIFQERGLSNRFADLTKELYIVALDLGSAKRVVFGGSPSSGPTICEAITASCAIPRLFGRVRIGDREYVDGAIGGDAHLDVVLARGASQVLVLNPIVPVCPEAEGSSPDGCRPQSQEGLGSLLDQCLKIAHATAFRCSMERTALRHPEVRLVILEPRPEEMFSNNPMDVAAVAAVLGSARAAIDHRMSEEVAGLAALFDREGTPDVSAGGG